ncbi:lipopolysaccharide ABC transporter permease LptF [Enterobacter cloacae]|uniref:Lipopolysaccharide ABC transporter permease LptF n=1 Tax=Enterobacter cloacae TaxID=550 RepID=A0A377LS72_ENTCL|nr:lipopolysaccharide ABC transporter permease LptF [Enterobacter cloacae]
MIIIRYLVRETLKSQLAILFILLLIFFCQKLVKILGAAVDGEIPTNLVLSLLGLGIPEMAQLILPLSLFLGLLMTLGKLYTESEITVMHACGLSKAVLVKAAMILALFTGIVAAVNVMWAGPMSSRHQDEVLAEAKANPGMAALAQGSSSRRPTETQCCLLRASTAVNSTTSSWRSCGPKETPVHRWWWQTPVSLRSAKMVPRS